MFNLLTSKHEHFRLFLVPFRSSSVRYFMILVLAIVETSGLKIDIGVADQFEYPHDPIVYVF